jgi:hypothetical protein
MKTHCFNSISFREGIATDEVGNAKPYMNTRRKMQWRRTVLGWIWKVIDDWGCVYGTGRCATKKEGKEAARTIVGHRRKQ